MEKDSWTKVRNFLSRVDVVSDCRKRSRLRVERGGRR